MHETLVYRVACYYTKACLSSHTRRFQREKSPSSMHPCCQSLDLPFLKNDVHHVQFYLHPSPDLHQRHPCLTRTSSPSTRRAHPINDPIENEHFTLLHPARSSHPNSLKVSPTIKPNSPPSPHPSTKTHPALLPLKIPTSPPRTPPH